MSTRKGFLFSLLAFALASTATAQSGLYVEIGPLSAGQAMNRADEAVRTFNRNADLLTQPYRDAMARAGRYNDRIPFSLPTVVHLTANRVPIQYVRPSNRPQAPGDITLQFDATGPRSFPQAYRDLLQTVFNQARPVMNAVFGLPSDSGVVLVKNYDADIGDRDAVAGGFFVPNNGSGQREIRFPIYIQNEAAAVNFIHTLLLAYIGTTPYGFDAFQEGLARAATMKVARSPGALPATLDSNLVEDVLLNSYDVGTFYDWYNQRALGGPVFIAPNLKTVPLPVGGSFGGLYLQRYQMAGTAWFKALVENPGFIAAFNSRYYQDLGSSADVPALIAHGQAALDTVKGTPNSTIEGLSFSDWFRRQFVLETKLTLGRKLFVQPVPIIGGLAGQDFGVFDLGTTYFETQAGGNEILLSGTSFPIFWDQSFQRFFAAQADDRIDIAGSYGSVTPNFGNDFGGQPYRVAVDVPVLDRLQRVYVPAGAVATAQNPTPNDFYGTVIGLNLPTGATAKVRLTINNGLPIDIPIVNFAFGSRINTAAYLGEARLRVQIVRTIGGVDTVLDFRFVNKAPGPLALDLRVAGDKTYMIPGGLKKGVQTIGFPLEPYSSDVPGILGVAENQTLVARFNPARAAYDFYPDTGPFVLGHGYFVRMEQAVPGFSVFGKSHLATPTAVALRPGWNLITPPIDEEVSVSRVQVIRTTDLPASYSEATGSLIGVDFFEFQPGANDAATGAPETGTMVVANSFKPGRAYFVRVLAPEGVTMLFMPSQVPGQMPTNRPQTGWRMQVLLSDGTRKSDTHVGQSTLGTYGLNWSEDSELPPGIGGFQASVENMQKMYRDIRKLGNQDTYRVRLEGLQVGKTYAVTFKMTKGSLHSFGLRDLQTGHAKTYVPTAVYTFTARAQKHVLELYAGGN